MPYPLCGMTPRDISSLTSCGGAAAPEMRKPRTAADRRTPRARISLSRSMAWVGTPNKKLAPVSSSRSRRLCPRGKSCTTSSPPADSAVISAPRPRLWLNGLSV